MATSDQTLTPSRSFLDRILSVSSRVEAGEGLTAMLLALNVFLLLGAYYVLKTVREALILAEAGAEVKSYASAGQALLFLVVVPAYGWIASRVNRVKLISFVLLFFISNLAIFFALGQAGANVGVPYYLWLGIFNMLAVAQFWAFANDLYSEEKGKRLFPIIGIGASTGAWVGSVFTSAIFRATGPYQLMALSGAVLGTCIALTVAVHRRESRRATVAVRREAEQPLSKSGGFRLVIGSRYLLLIALLVFLLNCVNTTGEYILGRLVTEQSAAMAATEAEQKNIIGEFYGNFFSWVNLLGFLIQTFLVSRIFKWIGVRAALFILPVIAFGGYGFIAFLPLLSIVKIAKILENSTDYSLNNTVRHALFLTTSREAKYKAKAAIDTFFVRAGDMLQAGIVFGGTLIGLSVSGYAMVTLGMVVIWLAIAAAIFREHRRRASE
jgi:ATP:ADP antiporter, AAA family